MIALNSAAASIGDPLLPNPATPWQDVPRVRQAWQILAAIDPDRLTQAERVACWDAVDCIVSQDLAGYPVDVQIAASCKLKGTIA